MMRALWLVLLSLGAMTVGTGAFARSAPAPTVRAGPCPIALDAKHFTCGSLIVPMTRRSGDARTVSLPYAVYSLSGKAPRDRAITLLSGGPGFTTLGFAAQVGPSLALLGRDIVFLERRGTGLATPALFCPPQMRRTDGSVDLAIVRACAAGYRKRRVDLDAFDSRQAAADLDDLRRLLVYGQWDLLGISYGTSLALAVMRDFPDTVHSAVLDSPYPLSVRPFESNVSKHLDALTRLFDACRADARCGSRYPDLHRRLVDAVDDLQRRPIDGSGTRLDGAALLRRVLGALQDAKGLTAIPAMIDAASKRDIAAWQALSPPAGGEAVGAFPQDKVNAQGLWFSVECRERLGATTQEDRRTLAAWPARLRSLVRVEWGAQDRAGCAAWGVTRDRRPIAAVIARPIPTLVLLGAFDPQTPQAWGEAVIASLPPGAGQLVIVPAAGHAVSTLPCPQEIIGGFLFNPGAPVDRRCLAKRSLSFKID